MTDRYAVIGNPIAQSKSPVIHHAFARQTGEDQLKRVIDCRLLIRCEAGQFTATVDSLRADGYQGLNVTAPFKRDAFDYATTLGEHAAKCGAVNTLRFVNGAIIGENTDGIGLTRDIETNLGFTILGARVLLVGAGGAARGAVGALAQAQPARLVIANRTPDRARDLALLFAEHSCVTTQPLDALGGACYDIVINATSASLSNQPIALPPTIFAHGALAYEMVYGRETPFMTFARAQNARTCDGLGMLVEQAAEAFYIWRGVRPDTASVRAMLGNR